MTKLFSRFLKDESGATAIEYGLIAALISVALIAGATTLGEKIGNTFNGLSTKMDDATSKAN
ncbi:MULTISPECIES: Flp family type IVb pilin [Rhizobium]|jgi:pilus assembly protein Flp/PilA|uniref:Flp family type IVb pilin n=1 Tax=Rhizobium TaxID=379 RepID=UPI0007EA8734|nr:MULTISPECIES: Flp family type IVb pilin [Rhizobium]ANK83862.1 Flp/Fap pilin component protein [Rhizobium sp. N731]ANK89755.1 Flp/Fap pilin component protein [Rhizobium sp. N6212]ANK95782.1 Flp/Fap pilin component protein [Rhizobium sp. N621]ANL01810.1 Flp/Fap pilin component protein [Rhizobium esperanzae]ANL07938.1 Flp/Fap pilin component protein [Rhizobium sp. N1341]